MPPQKLFCYRLPDEVDPAEFQGFTVVIIDVLRATSTITNALANGAAKVIQGETTMEEVFRVTQMDVF